MLKQLDIRLCDIFIKLETSDIKFNALSTMPRGSPKQVNLNSLNITYKEIIILQHYEHHLIFIAFKFINNIYGSNLLLNIVERWSKAFQLSGTFVQRYNLWL